MKHICSFDLISRTLYYFPSGIKPYDDFNRWVFVCSLCNQIYAYDDDCDNSFKATSIEDLDLSPDYQVVNESIYDPFPHPPGKKPKKGL